MRATATNAPNTRFYAILKARPSPRISAAGIGSHACSLRDPKRGMNARTRCI